MDNDSFPVKLGEENYVLSYSKMDDYGYVCITLVPLNFISKTTDAASNKMVITAILTSLILMAVVIFYIYRTMKSQLDLKKLAYQDSITGGMNINAFKERLQHDLREKDYSVILVNIKNFKLYNVDLGKNGGDALLKRIYEILHTAVMGNGYVARYYADIFYICLKTTDKGQILDFISKADTKIGLEAESFLKANQIELDFVINYGISTIQKGKDLQLAFDEACMACRERLPNEDGIPKFYNEDIHSSMERNQLLLASFKESIANHDFKIFPQAKIDPYKNTYHSSEALVRWVHPTLGLISPGEFIPLLESHGDIATLDFYMFEENCRVLRDMMDKGISVYPVSINLSGAHFDDRMFPERYFEISQKYRVPTHYLELELTETFFVHPDSISVMKENIKRLHEYGFKVAMDDFGSGISTISMLRHLDIDTLKIDKALIDNIADERTLPILEAVRDVVHKLNITTVVEGVETPEQLELVKKCLFDYVQGYIYSKPMPLDQFIAWASELYKVE